MGTAVIWDTLQKPPAAWKPGKGGQRDLMLDYVQLFLCLDPPTGKMLGYEKNHLLCGWSCFFSVTVEKAGWARVSQF